MFERSEAWQNMGRIWLVSAVILTALCDLAFGQSLAPFAGGNPPKSLELNRRHLGPTGKPCLAFQSYTSTQSTNKDIYEHWVGATNGCGQHIRVRVCYYRTDDCIAVDVQPFGRQNSVLGIFPALKDFQYEVKEQF